MMFRKQDHINHLQTATLACNIHALSYSLLPRWDHIFFCLCLVLVNRYEIKPSIQYISNVYISKTFSKQLYILTGDTLSTHLMRAIEIQKTSAEALTALLQPFPGMIVLMHLKRKILFVQKFKYVSMP